MYVYPWWWYTRVLLVNLICISYLLVSSFLSSVEETWFFFFLLSIVWTKFTFNMSLYDCLQSLWLSSNVLICNICHCDRVDGKFLSYSSSLMFIYWYQHVANILLSNLLIAAFLTCYVSPHLVGFYFLFHGLCMTKVFTASI